jgi:hypothetical protein
MKSLLQDQEKKKMDNEHIAYLGGILVLNPSSYFNT